MHGLSASFLQGVPKTQKIQSQNFRKVALSSFLLCLVTARGAAKNFNIGAQLGLHFLSYAVASKVCLKQYATYWFWCTAHRFTNTFLALTVPI